MNWNRVTAIFGGTFDPPHVGHKAAAIGLLAHPKVSRVIAVPAATPPHKPALVPAKQRLEMVKLAFSGSPVEINTCEFDRVSANSTEPSYSYQTIHELSQLYTELAFVIGADQLAALPTWKRFPELLKMCHWIILGRKPDGIAVAKQALQQLKASSLISTTNENSGKISGSTKEWILVETEAQALSSQQIREAIARTGEFPEGSLPSEVAHYLLENKLYGTRK